MKIKVCGLKEPGNIRAVEALQPNYMGFIFYPGSPRYINGLKAEVLKSVDASVIKTGVFVNDSFDHINAVVAAYSLDAVQLHGVENPEFCAGLNGRVQVIKAFNIGEHFDFSEIEVYAPHVDYFLFDTRSNKPGGSGLAFDWHILGSYKGSVPFFLSGGLSPENIKAAMALQHPQFYGVDLNSKFETSPGMKDIGELQEVFNLIRTFS